MRDNTLVELVLFVVVDPDHGDISPSTLAWIVRHLPVLNLT
jgi:hypothetical protein